MQITKVILRDFRGVHRLEIEINKGPIVFVGINGAGKSTVLDAVAALLSPLVSRLRSSAGIGRSLTDNDIRIDAGETEICMELLYESKPIRWSLVRTRSSRKKDRTSDTRELKQLVHELSDRLELGSTAILPLIMYYSVDRSVQDVSLRRRSDDLSGPVQAYDKALSAKGTDFREFFRWFRTREEEENERRIADLSFRDPQLNAVRRAVEIFLPGFRRLHVRRGPLRLVIAKGPDEFDVSSLSEGEKCLLALAGDLARRLAMANPGLPDPLTGQGIVMIDEVDLHLHPGWQREVVPKLCETFPNLQFLVSTHSPQVISQLRPENILIFHHGDNGLELMQPEESYGKDTNRILEDLMSVPDRPPQIKERIVAIFRLIDDGDLNEAQNRVYQLEEVIGSDPELVRAESLIRKLEILGG